MQDLDPFPLMQVSIEAEVWQHDTAFDLKDVGNALRAARNCFPLLHHKGHVDVILADDRLLQELNKTYRYQDKPTNVLSFPLENLKKGNYLPPAEFMLLGDIVLSYETIKSESLLQSKNFSHHFQHLVVHGFLHLLGFDHETVEDAEEMEALEIKILGSLTIPNPYEEIIPE